MMSMLSDLIFLAACLILTSSSSFAQSEEPRPLPRVGIGIKMSLLGAGVEAAMPIAPRSNLRVGVNAFSYDRGFHKDGINYAAQLGFRSVEAHYDWFPFGGRFHLSPGVLVYNGNQLKANASVPGGQTFALNHTTYASDPANPIAGTGKIDFKKAGPMLTVGWGNLLPGSHRVFALPIELGAVYTDSPRASLNLAGNACDAGGANCRAISSDAAVQSNIQAERSRLNKDMAAFKFYPVISLGFRLNF
jgi:hypothetical protein